MKTVLIVLSMTVAALGTVSPALNDAGTVFEIVLGLVQLADLKVNGFARA